MKFTTDIDYSDYVSPFAVIVDRIQTEMNTQIDNRVIATIKQNIGVDVNKEQLTQALAYDRRQYEIGYKAGY